jgi:hypothetical protein
LFIIPSKIIEAIMSLKVSEITPSVIQQRLKDNFTKATADSYWHFLAKTRSAEVTYQNPKIDAMLLQLGAESINQAGAFGWSPLHVAAMTGNAAAARFFLSKGASPLGKDQEGNTPAFYCTLMNHPDILEILAPQMKTPIVEMKGEVAEEVSPMTELFSKWRVVLPASAFRYLANTHDFGVQIDELLFTMPNDSSLEMMESYLKTGVRIDHFTKNLAVIAAKEGFKLTFSKYQFCVRDLLIRLPDGSIVAPSTSDNAAIACERTRSKAFVEKSSAAFRTGHTFFHGQMGAGLEDRVKGVTEIEDRFGHNNALHFYMEGGNHYFVTNATGNPRLLMGEDHFAIAVNQMRLDKIFDDPLMGVAKLAEEIEKGLTEEKIRAALPEMYAQGLLKSTSGAEKGLVTSQEMSQVATIEAAMERGFYRPLRLTQEQVLNCKKMVARYLAQKEITKELMGRYFGIPKRDVHFIPQAGYHLDTFMRPGPKGSYFVQDYGFCVELLETIKKQATELQLTQTDMEILERYLATARQLHQDLGPLLTAVSGELKKAGFLVIPTPGLFYDSASAAQTCNVDFLNAVTGWSAKTKTFYYIAAGASVGNRLGRVLMDAYRQFLDSYQKGIHVYFIGHNPDNPTDFTEAMSWWNRLGSQAGPHCFSLELRTKSKIG